MSEEIVFTLLYLVLSFCVIYPPVEFISAGFTIEKLFKNILGSEDEDFIMYHIRKSVVMLLTYSCIPLGYIVLFVVGTYTQQLNYNFLDSSVFWKLFRTTSLVLPVLALYKIRIWTADDFCEHPIALNLVKFCNNNNTDWRSVASDINTEFRRIDKISLKINPLVKVVATENWILKVAPFTIEAAHQSDASLAVKRADSYQFSHQFSNDTQFLNIEIKSQRRNVEIFTIRIGATDLKDLEDRIARDIAILPNVKFHKSVIEQFVDVFKETIKNNPRYKTDEDLDVCIGCMQARPNVKLQKLCEDESARNDSCTTCFCKPMWCSDCMAKWFASRQESDQQNTWLSSKCTCPMCRSKFCILDVSLIDDNNA